jgi:lysophospholipase L1-like esterase
MDLAFLREIRTLPSDLFSFFTDYIERIIILESEVAALEEEINALTLEISPIADYGIAMAEGTSKAIVVFGDSTHYGYLDGGGTASPDPCLTCQNALRAYYNNTAPVLSNQAVSSKGTTFGLSIWDTFMASIPAASIVWIAYGTNDASGLVADETKTAKQYAENLRTLATKARVAGHTVIFETSLPIVAFGGLGGQLRGERVKQFVTAMKQVAAEMNIPLLDTYSFFEQKLKFLSNPSLLFSDGIHLTQLGYNLRGYWMANMFMKAPILPVKGPIPSIDPSFRHYGGSNLVVATAGAATTYTRIGLKIQIPIQVIEPGTDIYLATPLWESGSTSLTIKSNAVTVYSGTLNSSALTASSFATDHEIMIIQNAAPGLYLIEMSSASNDCGLYYVLARPTVQQINPYVGSLTTLRDFGSVSFSSGGSGGVYNHAFTDLTTSSSLKDFTVELTATFARNQGFFIHGTGRSDGSAPWGGILVFLHGSTGYLTIGTGAQGTYDNVNLYSVDLSAVSHNYKLVMTSSTGAVEVFVDNISRGTYTPLIPYVGGRFGVFTSGANTTVSATNVRTY